MDNQKLIESIESTGFDLEYYVYETLRQNNWVVMNNRYYVDEIEESEREIDLIAYKVKTDDANKFLYYTVLIISCKKSKEGLWAFLTYKRPESDPNFKYFIVDNFTHDKRLGYMLKIEQENIEAKLNEDEQVKQLFEVNNRVFAFQQINQKSYKSEDDKKIYSSIITSIKALEYEKGKRLSVTQISGYESCFYNFNLLTIFDGEMVEIDFSSNKTVTPINEIKYVNRHIINKKEQFYKVHFVTKNCFAKWVENYNALYSLNGKVYPSLIESFYKDIFADKQKVDLLWKDFCEKIKWSFDYSIQHKLNYKSENQVETFKYEYKNEILTINFYGYFDIEDDDLIKRINEEDFLRKRTKELLLRFFRYSGQFAYDNDILPF